MLEQLPASVPDAEVFRIESEYIVKFNSIDNGFNSVISCKSVNELILPSLFEVDTSPEMNSTP